MVIDVLLDRSLDALASWYGANKERKANAAQLLLELRRLMNKPVLHMRMSEERGSVMRRTYLSYLEGDIERLDDFISLHAPEIAGDLMTSANAFSNYLVESYISLKVTSLGYNEDLKSHVDSTKKYVEETSAMIDDLLTEG